MVAENEEAEKEIQSVATSLQRWMTFLIRVSKLVARKARGLKRKVTHTACTKALKASSLPFSAEIFLNKGPK